MKEQTYISYLEDENGNIIDFQRWTYKKISTIIKYLKTIYNNHNGICWNLRKKELKKSKYITIYDKNNKLATKILINEILDETTKKELKQL